MADQVVQVGHACLEAAWRFPAPPVPCALVVLAVPSREALLDARDRLERLGIACALFVEPDDGMGPTALCSAPLPGPERRAFRRYPLWTLGAASPARAPPSDSR